MLNQFYPNLTFPRAQHVRVFFLAPYTKTLDNSSQTIHAIDKFTHKVRTMVPHAHSIQATVYSFEYMAVPREFNYCSRVLNNLYSQLRSAEYHGWKNPQWHGMLDDPHTELTSLTYDWMNFGEESYALFYTHARTLQSLRLNSGAAINYNRLFQKPDNSNLRHFSHNQMYPFDDDTIFRGNRDIIKSINIFIGSTSFESLKRHGMFSTNQLCESLQHLSISKEADSLMLGKFELPANMLQNWLAIAPVLQTLNVLVDEPVLTKVD
ncbi:hypothetical protein IW144_001042 [Coemansia sp. RSA 522]|nr:hypothetical protein IW144_001042 [Coemansia sp. RSA 522]